MTQPMPHVARMAPYTLVKVPAGDDHTLISLSQNESLRPPSPKVVKAASSVFTRSMLYPDPDWTELRLALAQHHELNAEYILCGNGSLDLIGCIARVFAGPDRSILAPEYAYPFFRSATQMANARFDIARESFLTVNVQAILDSVVADTGIVFVANPGNPTGTRISRGELERLRAGLRPDILLVVDEAYGEFADHLRESCFDMVNSENTVILRTFSKAYGMAGFRVGWGLFPPAVAAEMRKVMNPNNVSAVSQAAAIAAVQDEKYMRETCEITTQLREEATTKLKDAGFDLFPSFTNFVLIDMGDPESAQNAEAALRRNGILVRPQGGVGLPHALRMTIGAKQDNEAAISILAQCKKEHAR
ncbi:pyridoxal phosphate-dependent aminotransferase [Ruegeria arenilitoris]|uniref:pyridoxal phosphate-dependent aminotransferase n=1 Tax=Ruegeria arenilitoris TaxID=1173585 RepID=UPI001C2C6B0E|nr:histidinol-phosphate transaminase [Ruegeria arenilitoris]